jgi:hypothetical protein
LDHFLTCSSYLDDLGVLVADDRDGSSLDFTELRVDSQIALHVLKYYTIVA